jgi:hypothetical protein
MRSIKIITLTATFLFSGVLLYAQPTETSIMIDNANRSAVTITIDQPDNITGDALQQRLEHSGLKDKPKNGIMSFKGVVLSEISAEKIDLYTKVEKGPNNSSVVYIAVSRGYNNFTNGPADSAITQNVKTFLLSFVKDANDRSADVGISNRINDVNKDQKAYQKLLDEQGDLQKKKTKIENRLLEIQNELDMRTVELNKKKTGVEDARAKRKRSGTSNTISQ